MPQEPKKKKLNWFAKHKIITGILAAIILISIGSAMGSSSDSNSPTASKTASKAATGSQPLATPGLNQEADDGDFGFTVTAFQCGQATLAQPDNTDWTTTAQGQFCTMSLTIKNIKNAAQTFDDSSQYVFSYSGTQYSSSNDGTITANPSGSNCMMYASINPGNTLNCVIAFDVPKDVTPAYAILHDSSASNGVKVNL